MLKAQKAAPYVPTADDRLWLARAVAAEGPPQPMVARALVNLFMMQRSKGSTQTLAHLVRAYAQPVNPRWMPGGDLHIAALEKGEDTEAQASRRLAHSSRPMAAMPPYVTAAVDGALTASFLSDVTDYAAPTLDASKKGYRARGEPVPGYNRMWTRAPGWSGYVIGEGGSLLPFVVGVALLWLSYKG